MAAESFSSTYLAEAAEIAKAIPAGEVERMAERLAQVRERGGRLFILGVGGGAGHASHAVNDFRKLCGIESYTPVDNVSELTARTNDEGWETSFEAWLETSRLGPDVAIVVPAPAERITPHAEAFQAVIWHLLVSHPALATQATKWESIAEPATG